MTKNSSDDRTAKTEMHWDNRTISLLEHMAEGFLVLDREWCVIYANPRCEEIVQRRREELVGEKLWSLFPLLVNHPIYQLLHKALEREEEVEIHDFFVGPKQWMQVRAYPGGPGLFIHFYDVTETKQTEDQLLYLAHLDEISSDALISIDTQGRITRWNKAAENIYGWSRQEALGEYIEKLLPVQVREEDQETYKREMEERGFWMGKLQQRQKDGRWLFIHGSVTRMRDRSGKIIGTMSINRDISQQESIERALQESEQRLQIAVETAQLGTWYLDLVNGHLNCSERCKANYGLKPETFFTYTMLRKMIVPEDREQMQRAVEKALDPAEKYEAEYRILWPDGSLHWVLATGRSLRDGEGKAFAMVGMTLDITERKLVDQRKDEFISMASHELRTPLTSIKAFAQILRKRFEREKQPEPLLYLTKMETQINKLTRLVSELLDLSRMQAGKMAFVYERFDFNALVSEVVETIQLNNRQRIFVKGGVEQEVMGDREHLGQVLINLLNNALKYSQADDSVIVQVASNEENVVVSVQDFGIGIPQEHLAHIFERFYRAANAKDKTYPGLGIGLYISYEIIQRHHGTLRVESVEHRGSTFTFTLPLNQE